MSFRRRSLRNSFKVENLHQENEDIEQRDEVDENTFSTSQEQHYRGEEEQKEEQEEVVYELTGLDEDSEKDQDIDDDEQNSFGLYEQDQVEETDNHKYILEQVPEEDDESQSQENDETGYVDGNYYEGEDEEDQWYETTQANSLIYELHGNNLNQENGSIIYEAIVVQETSVDDQNYDQKTEEQEEEEYYILQPVSQAKNVPSQLVKNSQNSPVSFNAPVASQKTKHIAFKIASNNYIPTRSVRPLTIPKEFNLSKPKVNKITASGSISKLNPSSESTIYSRTSRSAKLSTNNRTSMVLNKILSTSKNSGVQKKQKGNVKRTITVPKPFQLATSVRCFAPNAKQPAKSPYKPLAQVVNTIQNATPERFKKQVRETQVNKVKQFSLTEPKSPMLVTKLRAKPLSVINSNTMSSQQQNIHSQFKARPINHKILQSSKPLGVPQPQKFELTVPESPALRTKYIVRKTVKATTPVKHFKANPIRNFAPVHVEYRHEHTEPQEFHLPGDQISRRKKEAFEEQVAEIYASIEEKRRFKSHPLPDDVPDYLPKVAHIPMTRPIPFQLETEMRGQIYRYEMENQLMQQQVQEEIQKIFRAQPMPSHHTPFIPKKSNKAPTQVEPVFLHTDVRVEERRVFDECIRRRVTLEEEIRKQLEDEYKQREEEELKEIRKHLVHQAQPIRHYAPIRIQPSTRPLTQPMSPFIGEKRKQQQMFF